MHTVVKVTVHGQPSTRPPALRSVRMLMSDVRRNLFEGPFPIIVGGVVTRGITIESISEEERRAIERAIAHDHSVLGVE